jgi:hypothetical protein
MKTEKKAKAQKKGIVKAGKTRKGKVSYSVSSKSGVVKEGTTMINVKRVKSSKENVPTEKDKKEFRKFFQTIKLDGPDDWAEHVDEYVYHGKHEE